MNWEKLLSRKRYGVAGSSLSVDNESRTIFEADIQRIIFSGVFRRLNKKTQVHPLIANDHVHTRLTHSIEVSQVGKILGKMVGGEIDLPDGYNAFDIGSIVEAACLAHDLGNPPFGHAGEEAMKYWFETEGQKIVTGMDDKHKKDILNFEGNAQGLRILTQTENYMFNGGLRLTYATLATFMKYPWTSEKHGKKFGAFLSESKILENIATEVGLIKKSNHEWSRHPLAYLVEAADDICYGILDLEDAVELKIIRLEEVVELYSKVFNDQEWARIKVELKPSAEFRVNLSRLRGRVFEKTISAAFEGFMKAYPEIMKGEYEGSVFDILDDSDKRKDLIKKAKKLAQKSIYSDFGKVEIELGSYSTFRVLLQSFSEAVLENHLVLNSKQSEIGWKSKQVLKILGEHSPKNGNQPPDLSWNEYQCLRRVIDFISGMTDNYAIYISEQIQGASAANKFRY